MERDEIKRVEQELDAILKLVIPEAPAAKDFSADGCPDEAKKEGSAETDTQEEAFRGLGAVKETAASQEPGDGEDELEAKDGFYEVSGAYSCDDEGKEKDESGSRSEQEYLPEAEEKAQRFRRKAKVRGLKLLKPSDGLAVAFFIPVVVLIIIFSQRGIFPFGEESFLRTDMYHQYAPFFSEFQHKLTNGGSLFYSWDIGMGVNFSALYAYYLASPMNWLLILCPKPYIIEFMTILIVLKTGLSGLSFSWYLRRHFKTMDFGVGLFGIFYALSGYMAAYSWNIMWLDCILLFPVILLGLERLVKEGKGMLYCIALGISILSNYYISIMICIFMVIYVIVQMLLYPPEGFGAFLKTCGRFALYSLLAGALSAVVLLPEIFALQATASGNFDFPKDINSYFSIFDMIARHIENVGTEIGLDHWPNIYCGVAVLMFFLLYLGSRGIALKEKIVYCAMLLLFYASFSTNVLNFIWHGFHFPNSLPCRQSFIYIALILYMCYEAYIKLSETPVKYVTLAFWGAVSFVLLAEKLVDNPEQFHFSVFYVAILLLAVYGGLILLYKKRKWSLDAVLLTALAVVSIESAVNMAVTSIPTTSRTAYVQDNQEVEELTSKIRSNTFYRVEKVDRKTKNDGAWMNFPSVSLFSSTADAALSRFFTELGCESSTNAYSITGSTPLVDSLFAVKYGLYSQEPPASSLMELSGRSGGTLLYENLYTLPVAFMLPSDVENNWILDSGNPAYVQNDLCALLGTAPVLISNESHLEGKKLTFTPEISGDYYVYVTNKRVKEVTAVIGQRTESFDNVDRGFFLELGYLARGQEVSLEATGEDAPVINAEVWRFNQEAMISAYNKMNRNPIVLTSWTDTGLKGTITADENGVMYTSIPYDKGWRITVDGSEVSPRKLFDTFLGIDLTAGVHEIDMSYEPEGLRAGAWITGGSIAALGIIGLAGYGKRKKKAKGCSKRRKWKP